MEGKETRFGIASSALFAAVATGTSSGAVNSAHDSMTPLGGFVPMFLMQLGEVAPGGVGTGIYSILMFAILGVFIAGLMIGRTPEYLGKKIEAFEMKMASVFILTTPFAVLIGTAVAVMTVAGKAGAANPGAHGFSEILYAFTSAANNNGSAFARHLRRTRFFTTLRPAWRCSSAVSGRSWRRSPSPDRSRRRSASRSPKAPCRRMDLCSWRCSSARFC